jgi:hypothetical protein
MVTWILATSVRPLLIKNRRSNEIDPLAVANQGVHKIPSGEVIAGDQRDIAVDLRTLVSGAADDLTVGLLYQHLHPLSDSLRCALRN